MEANECKIYVGNLPFSVGFAELKELFSKFGEITDAIVIADKYSGRSKGFGFVTFDKKESADKAVSNMNESEVQGRKLKVSIAKPSEKEHTPERENK